MYSVYSFHVLEVFISVFTRNTEILSLETRQSGPFNILLIRKDISKTGIRYKDVIIWTDITNNGVRADKSDYVVIKELEYIILDGLL